MEFYPALIFLIFGRFYFQLGCSQVEIHPFRQNRTIMENNSSRFPCRAEANNNSLQDVQWYRIRNGERMLVSYNSTEDDFQDSDGTFTDRLRDQFLTYTGNVEDNRAAKDFVCVAQAGNVTVERNLYVKIDAFVSLSLVNSSDIQTYCKGRNEKLTCTFRGFPHPIVRWEGTGNTSDEVNFTTDYVVGETSLYIFDIQETSNFTCIANRSQFNESIEHSFMLEAREGCGPVEIHSFSSSISVPENDSMQIRCRAEALNADLQNIQWYRVKNGAKIVVLENPLEDDFQERGRFDEFWGDQHLTITGKVEENRAAKDFVCIATTGNGSISDEQALYVQIDAVVPLRLIDFTDIRSTCQGHSEKLTCVFRGFPHPDVRWESVGNTGVELNFTTDYIVGETNLYVFNIQESSTFTCVAVSMQFNETVQQTFRLEAKKVERLDEITHEIIDENICRVTWNRSQTSLNSVTGFQVKLLFANNEESVVTLSNETLREFTFDVRRDNGITDVSVAMVMDDCVGPFTESNGSCLYTNSAEAEAVIAVSVVLGIIILMLSGAVGYLCCKRRNQKPSDETMLSKQKSMFSKYVQSIRTIRRNKEQFSCGVEEPVYEDASAVDEMKKANNANNYIEQPFDHAGGNNINQSFCQQQNSSILGPLQYDFNADYENDEAIYDDTVEVHLTIEQNGNTTKRISQSEEVYEEPMEANLIARQQLATYPAEELSNEAFFPPPPEIMNV